LLKLGAPWRQLNNTQPRRSNVKRFTTSNYFGTLRSLPHLAKAVSPGPDKWSLLTQKRKLEF
jgi:hypothetical protein